MTLETTTILGLVAAGFAAWQFRFQIAGLLGGLKSAAGNLATTAADAVTPGPPAAPAEPTDDDLQGYWLAIYKRLAKQGCADGQKALTDLVLPHLTEHPPHPAAGPGTA